MNKLRIGAIMFATDKSIAPTELARAIEERGLDGLFVPEHTHIPLDTHSPFFPDGKLPAPYLRTFDPFVVLGAAAAVTERIDLGTGICLVSQRHPISLAKEVATLDSMSNGRFIFGVGAGWNKPEIENHGVAFETRWKVLEERVAAMKEIWSQENAAFHGKYVNFDPIWSHPKPVQRPWPQITMGASTPYGRERVARYCDGWLPIDMMVEDLAADIADLHARVRKHGRRPEDIEVSIFWAADDVDKLKRYRDLGVQRAIMGVPSLSETETLKLLDHYATLPAQVG